MKVFQTTVEETEDLALFKLMRKRTNITLKSLRVMQIIEANSKYFKKSYTLMVILRPDDLMYGTLAKEI